MLSLREFGAACCGGVRLACRRVRIDLRLDRRCDGGGGGHGRHHCSDQGLLQHHHQNHRQSRHRLDLWPKVHQTSVARRQGHPGPGHRHRHHHHRDLAASFSAGDHALDPDCCYRHRPLLSYTSVCVGRAFSAVLRCAAAVTTTGQPGGWVKVVKPGRNNIKKSRIYRHPNRGALFAVQKRTRARSRSGVAW